MEILEYKLDELKEYENNPRDNEESVSLVANSIREFGFKVPIVVDKDNVIIAGHTRLKAARELGLETVPVIKADDLTEDQVKAFRLADNKVSEFSKWDMNKLEQELQGIDIDMFDFGFVAAAEEELAPINDEGLEKTKDLEYKLKFGNKTVIMTEDEYNDLMAKFDEYTEEYGVTFGFVRWLINGN